MKLFLIILIVNIILFLLLFLYCACKLANDDERLIAKINRKK